MPLKIARGSSKKGANKAEKDAARRAQKDERDQFVTGALDSCMEN